MDLRMIAEEDAVTDHEVGSQHADRVEPFDGRLAVAMHHLVEFDDCLAGMRLHRDVAPLGFLVRFLEVALLASIDLRGADHRRDAPAGMLQGGVDGFHRRIEGLLARLLVPGVFNGVAVLGVPVALAHHRADNGADAGLGEIVDPALAAHRQIGNGGDAALQELGHRHLGRGAGILGVEAEHRQVFVERALPQLVAAILLRQALVGGFGEGMAVHVDEARDRHEPLAVDRGVGRAGVTRPDMDHLVALEHEIAAVEIDMAALGFVPCHDMVEAGDLRRLGHGISSVGRCLRLEPPAG
jgi:hypothetical protein